MSRMNSPVARLNLRPFGFENKVLRRRNVAEPRTLPKLVTWNAPFSEPLHPSGVLLETDPLQRRRKSFERSRSIS